MKIKDYKCVKCGKDDFIMINRNMHVGIHCKYCGAFLKWANKDERRLKGVII